MQPAEERIRGGNEFEKKCEMTIKCNASTKSRYPSLEFKILNASDDDESIEVEI